MKFSKKVVDELYEISNPIIKYRIDKEFHGLDVKHSEYVDYGNYLIDYWLNVYDDVKIHGASDNAFENVVGKLLDFGFDSTIKEFDDLFGNMTETMHWQDGMSFNNQLNNTVIYPFLVRAGYLHNDQVQSFLKNRVDMIEKSILKYGYDLEMPEADKPKIHKGKFVFKNDIATECLPTIYDLYAFAYYPDKSSEIGQRIERIIEYILDERFMNLPDSGYVYDTSNKMYYAAGNVYHACLRKDRYILYLYLLSFFESSRRSKTYMNEIESLKRYKTDNGFYVFDKNLMKEKKDTYQIYTGGHMGLGENRRSKNTLKIESTFWMMSILHNIEK